MEVGQSTLHVQSIQLDEWAEQLISDFKPEASVRGITLVYQPEPEIQTLCFDKEKCTTILTNLLINALKYTPDESTISISTRLSEDKTRVRISISDQGPGLKDVDTNSLIGSEMCIRDKSLCPLLPRQQQSSRHRNRIVLF